MHCLPSTVLKLCKVLAYMRIVLQGEAGYSSRDVFAQSLVTRCMYVRHKPLNFIHNRVLLFLKAEIGRKKVHLTSQHFNVHASLHSDYERATKHSAQHNVFAIVHDTSHTRV